MAGNRRSRGLSQPEDTAHVLSHLIELRRRLIFSLLAVMAGFVAAFAFYEPLVDMLRRPFSALEIDSVLSRRLFVHAVTEGFLVRVRIALVGGVVLALPVIVYHMLRFVFPGLYRKERRTIAAALSLGTVLAVAAFFYSYVHLLPISLRFLTGSGFIPEEVGVLLSYRRSIAFVLQVLLMAVVLFQLPVVVLVLLKLNVVTRRGALKGGRYVIVVLFGVSAILTPPDVVSQLGLALPLVVLYYGAVFVAGLFRLGEG
ncbi:MAG: twin-arginine translocase subunit TatC [Spirochaetota bacterium]